MTIFKLIFKEIFHRKFNFILSLLAVTITIGIFVGLYSTGRAYRRETIRIMRDMGQNLRIIPKQTKMDQFWSTGFSEHTMPEEYVIRFKSLKKISYTHLNAILQKKVTWHGRKIILAGTLPEVLPLDKLHQKPMTFTVKPGTVFVGYELANILNIKKGDTIDLFGKKLTVAKCLSKTASDDDIRIYGHLHDIQQILNMKGRINEIKALECYCVIEPEKGDVDVQLHDIAQQELAKILPDTKVVLLSFIAVVRQKQRAAVEGYLAFIMPFVMIVCGLWIGFLALINVRERRSEIGIMRAVGYNSFRIGLLFIGKAVFIGIIAAAAGFALGTALALKYGPEIFTVTARAIKPQYNLLGWVILFTPLFTAVASFIPAMIAVVQEPASTLKEE